MNTPIKAWVDLTLHQAQRCHHLAWFLYGCIDRAHRLNMNAFAASWVGEWQKPGFTGTGAYRRSSA